MVIIAVQPSEHKHYNAFQVAGSYKSWSSPKKKKKKKKEKPKATYVAVYLVEGILMSEKCYLWILYDSLHLW